MRSELAALIGVAAIAIVAAVFAIWPVVSDAPWEDETAVDLAESRKIEVRCQGALALRAAAVQAYPGPIDIRLLADDSRYPDYPPALSTQLEKADGEIDRFCFGTR